MSRSHSIKLSVKSVVAARREAVEVVARGDATFCKEEKSLF
jgi:hypothetical protein